MMNRLRSSLALSVLLCGSTGCDLFTGPDPLENFEWVELTPGQTVEERVEVTSLPGEIYILGEFNTPTTCYVLGAEFSRAGSRLRLRIRARSNETPNCQQVLGAFRYTAVLRHLDRGSYEITVVHDVGGGETREFTETATIR